MPWHKKCKVTSKAFKYTTTQTWSCHANDTTYLSLNFLIRERKLSTPKYQLKQEYKAIWQDEQEKLLILVQVS
jgi:hypothetical protein